MLWKVVFQCYGKNRVSKFPGNLASTKIVWILEILWDMLREGALRHAERNGS